MEDNCFVHCIDAYLVWLESQEDIAPIQHSGEEEEQGDGDDGEEDVAKVPEGSFDGSTDETFCDLSEVQQLGGEIDRDRIHANPYEWLTPNAFAEHIDHEVKRSQQEEAVPAGNQHETGGPELLDDRHFKAPETSNDHASDSAGGQDHGFGSSWSRRCHEEYACQHPKKR